MLDGYKILESGLIEKLQKPKFQYDKIYSGKYDSYGELSNYMAHLRTGFIAGVLGRYPESILDIGYGNGAFLKCCSNVIKNCFGYDVSDYPIPEKCYKLEKLNDSFYEVVTFFDSLEHFEDPTFVKNLNCKFVCVSVPWCHYNNVPDSDTWLKNWKHLRPEEHFWHFDEKSLTNFMNENGYDFLCGNNLEDIIRKPEGSLPNILTCMFKKKLN